MHPGAGSTQGPDGLDHFTLAQYTVSHGGHAYVTDLSVATPSGGSNGTELWVNVDSGPDLVPIANRVIPGGGAYGGPTTIDLGVLSAGDRIYVGIGPNGVDGNDSTNIQFQIQQTPEPSSLLLCGLGGVGSSSPSVAAARLSATATRTTEPLGQPARAVFLLRLGCGSASNGTAEFWLQRIFWNAATGSSNLNTTARRSRQSAGSRYSPAKACVKVAEPELVGRCPSILSGYGHRELRPCP